MLKTKVSLSVLVACTALAGCGGGGDSSTPVVVGPTAEGAYSGTTTGARNSDFSLLILENGDFWTLYGNRISGQFLVSAVIQGSGNSTNGSFTSSNVKDFGVMPALAGTLNATYNATAKTISGTIAAGASTISFSGGPADALYNYNTAASLANIVGSWVTTSTSGETVNINIASAGTFSAAGSSGCNFSGTVKPRTSGKNVFETTMTFGPAPCGLPGQTASRIALSYPLVSGQTQLVLAQVDSTRAFGSAAFGTR